MVSSDSEKLQLLLMNLRNEYYVNCQIMDYVMDQMWIKELLVSGLEQTIIGNQQAVESLKKSIDYYIKKVPSSINQDELIEKIVDLRYKADFFQGHVDTYREELESREDEMDTFRCDLTYFADKQEALLTDMGATRGHIKKL